MFKKVYLFYLSYLVAMTYSQMLLLLWFLNNGVSYVQMLIYFLVMYVSVLTLYLILRKITFSSRFALVLGVASSALGVLVANFMTKPTDIFYTAVLFGVNIVFFWTVYNMLHFKESLSHEHGKNSGAYFLFMPIFTAILAPISGQIVENFGYHVLFVSAMFVYLIPLYIAFSIPSFKFKFEFWKAARKMEHKILLIFQGYNSMLSYNVVPIFTLFYINTPGKLGNFFGYLAILSALTAFINSKFSDKKKTRKIFFYTFIILNAICFIPLALTNTLLGWQAFSGVSNFAYGLANPFNMALVMDHAKGDITDTMLGREIYLNSGRVIMILVALAAFLSTGSLKMALLISICVALLYPITAYFNRVYLK